ncbi:MAG: hypothetical protein HKN32_09290, partial [Flavobacteriales bacterium]|nr:hypothetical protein [Flavobacteriales bacterium]
MKNIYAQLANLIRLALADGKLNNEEVSLIYGLADKHGITQDELDNIIDHLDEEVRDVPEELEDRVRH